MRRAARAKCYSRIRMAGPGRRLHGPKQCEHYMGPRRAKGCDHPIPGGSSPGSAVVEAVSFFAGVSKSQHTACYHVFNQVRAPRQPQRQGTPGTTSRPASPPSVDCASHHDPLACPVRARPLSGSFPPAAPASACSSRGPCRIGGRAKCGARFSVGPQGPCRG